MQVFDGVPKQAEMLQKRFPSDWSFAVPTVRDATRLSTWQLKDRVRRRLRDLMLLFASATCPRDRNARICASGPREEFPTQYRKLKFGARNPCARVLRELPHRKG